MSESRRHKNKGISKETINQIKLRNAGWRDYRRQPSEDKLRRYKDIRNYTNALVTADKDRHMSRTLQSFKGKPKKFCAHMRRLQTVKDRVMQLKKQDGSLTKIDKETAEELCRTFNEVFVIEEEFDCGTYSGE